ncbi:MAG: hypothetical protein IJC89_00065 [Clostridia bacterium]|nr:hypothetical protein [Clostridia bacterium]
MVEKVNIFDVFMILLKRWWIIIICAVVFGAGAYSYSRFVQEKEYMSVGRMYIGTYNGGKIDDADTGNKGVDRTTATISASQRSVLTCIEVLKSTRVLSKVADDVNEKTDGDYKASRLRSMLTMTSANETEILEIQVNGPKKEDLKIIVDSLLEIGGEELVEIVGVSTAYTIDEGVTDPTHVSPNIPMQSVIGALLGGIIASFIILVIALCDKRVRTEEELQRYNIPIIGVVPEME